MSLALYPSRVRSNDVLGITPLYRELLGRIWQPCFDPTPEIVEIRGIATKIEIALRTDGRIASDVH